MSGCALVHFTKQKHEINRTYYVNYCKKCAVGVTQPFPDDVTLHKLHSTQYYRNGEGFRFLRPFEMLVEAMRWWRVYRLSKFVDIGKALDIGCGSGRFLLALRALGWNVAGLELNDDTAKSARLLHSLEVKTSLNSFDENTFDLITITHVLEHIRDPQQMLKECSLLLKPGGVIAVAVPNINSWQAFVTRGGWFHLDLPRHLWHFSENWLSNTLRIHGFVIIKVRRLDFAHNIFGWLQSLLNCMCLRHNRLYSFLSCDDLETDRRSHYSSLFISLFLLPFLLPISILLTIIEAFFHRSGTVEIIARFPNADSRI